MDDVELEYLDLDAELQVALPKDGKEYLKQFGGLQGNDLGSTLSGTYYAGVPLDENPEAIFDILSRESRRYRKPSSVKESRNGSAFRTVVTSSEDSDSSVKAPDRTQNGVRVIGRAERRHQTPGKRVSFNDESKEKENRKLDSQKALDKKSRFFPQRNDKLPAKLPDKLPAKDKILHTPLRDGDKSPKKGKGLKFSGFSKLLHKRNDEKHLQSTPRSALSNRPTKYEDDIARSTSDVSQVYNTIGDIEIGANRTTDLDEEYNFEDVNEIEICYGAAGEQNGGASTASNRRTTSSASSGSSKVHSTSALLYNNTSSGPTSHTLLTLPTDVSDVVEILSTEPSLDDVINRKRHLAISSSILKMQEPLPSAATGNVEKLRMFVESLSRDTILRTVDDEGQTALHLAIAHSHLDCVILLCSKFPEMLQSESKDKLTPSSLAIKAGKIEILDWLIEHTSVSKEFSSTKYRRSLVHQAAKFGQDGCLRLLLDKLQTKGTIREPLDVAGNTPAHLAAKYGHLSCLQTLVEYGRDVCLANQGDVTPFQCALAANHRHCAAYLVAIHSNRQMARKLAFKGALIKKYEEHRKILRSRHRELLDMTRDSKPSQSQRDLHGNLAETLDHVVTQMEDLYIENSALRQRFNGAKQGSFVLRDDVKAMLSKLKSLRQDLERTQEVGINLTSGGRLEELQRYTDDVTKTGPPTASVDQIAWQIQRESFSKVYQEMYHPQPKHESQSPQKEETQPKEVQEDKYDFSDIEFYETHDNLTSGESYRNKRRRRTRVSHEKGTDLLNDLEKNTRTGSRGHDLIPGHDGRLEDDTSDSTYDELSHMSSFRSSNSGGAPRGARSMANRAGLTYERPHVRSVEANVIEVIEPVSGTSIDLPNGSSEDVEDDIDAMDSISQVGEDHGERTRSQYSWQGSVTTKPDLTANCLPSTKNDILGKKLDSAKNTTSIANDKSFKSGLPYSSHTRTTKDLAFSKDESRKQWSSDRPNDGSQRAVTRSHISGAKAGKPFEQSENIPRKHEKPREELRRAEKISGLGEGEMVGFTAVLCGTDKEHISKGHEILAAEELLEAHLVSGHPTSQSARSSLDLADKRSSRLRDIEQDSEDILMALGSDHPEDVEPTLPSDGSLRIPPSMQFEMRLATIEEASVVSGGLPCDEEEEEVVSSDDDADDEQEDGNSSTLPDDSCVNQLEDSSLNTAANEFSGDEKPWYENSDEDDVTTWQPRRTDQHGREEHLTLL